MKYAAGQEYSILAEGVTKTYSDGWFAKQNTYALREVSVRIKKGEIFGLLGPNGAGKTTLLNICATLLKADSGTVMLFGRSLGCVSKSELSRIRTRMNMCSGNPNFPWSLTVRELLTFYAMLYGLKRQARRRAVSECLALFELEEFTHQRYDRLSTGTKQKVALAKSFINDPQILFLDEPTLGLDVDIAHKIRDIIKRVHLKKQKTVVLTTHYMKEAEELCDRIAFISKGTIVAEGTSQDLKNKTNAQDLEGVFLELIH
jgi:ABC-2 type transport system ATP-binding protein